jgi:hypothetical protein
MAAREGIGGGRLRRSGGAWGRLAPGFRKGLDGARFCRAAGRLRFAGGIHDRGPADRRSPAAHQNGCFECGPGAARRPPEATKFKRPGGEAPRPRSPGAW